MQKLPDWCLRFWWWEAWPGDSGLPAEAGGNLWQRAAPSTQAQDGLVLIPQGTFTMGSPDSERQREKDETAHEVSVSAFYLSPTEVTQEQYQQVMGENPSHFQGQQLPVENVTWYQAVSSATS